MVILIHILIKEGRACRAVPYIRRPTSHHNIYLSTKYTLDARLLISYVYIYIYICYKCIYVIYIYTYNIYIYIYMITHIPVATLDILNLLQ